MCGKEFDEPKKTPACAGCAADFAARRVRYDELAAAQGHVCAVCGGPETATTKLGKPRRLSIDHCHRTGRVRELLCMKCNTLLGGAKDDPDILERAAAYLRKHA